MTKRKRSEERGCRTARRPRPAQEPKQHLYLLLDDWERGYSIRKVDVEAFDSDTNTPPKRFTEPPVARIEAPHVRSWNFISHASKIFAMKAKEASPAIPAFDTHTMSLTISPWPSCRAGYVTPLLASIGGKLSLFLEDRTEYLADPPPYDSNAPWSWSTINSPLPFYNVQILCYALHPDGRTLFVSAGSRRKNLPSTFSFDAERLEWAHHGNWLLPFAGQAYFDAELEAWVGLARDKESSGYLCSCDVPPVAAKLTSPPSWKLGQDKMFSKDSELHRGAKLVYMGDSKFCLIESLFHKDDQHLRRDPTEMDLWGATSIESEHLLQK
ncbi:uncharacterized protein [Aegilops tauschii subsp. strangulata]|nr:uncharacterized protein LOC109738674 [Aegilops tauschii subsp. strangulata]XP_040259592.1 uncharacterized protein LOC109738674 [Aegilops tauschii subsp. strangulata]XP_040259593.1 uncharacterized protein LOC109738674 [Aegilops tauschii subsp. strangulata]XP_040259594.1 uncharacterized protein LOC109738674 [Aegilops tauschii subsp. strangulata]XP_040259598.1 uncharacterized protein LOC109738674 [Aegilops tauschii subsp. strangulata]XP_040259599.1 uncharacterized protein LOC109738674 [Aegilop